ncbi:MAG: hypothetical protein WC516_08030 [Patescibacteria group bacterium]
MCPLMLLAATIWNSGEHEVSMSSDYVGEKCAWSERGTKKDGWLDIICSISHQVVGQKDERYYRE